jgi:ABC-type amino acid transport substrate-binding protein
MVERIRNVRFTPQSGQHDANMATFQSRGKIIAGVSFGIPGTLYKTPQTGRIEGFEADLARALPEKLLIVQISIRSSILATDSNGSLRHCRQEGQ